MIKINYPQELPISAHRNELVSAIKSHDVIVVVGETGSGKSTQIPKMIYEALGEGSRIVCTQPRRIAAVSIAARIAEECEVEFGTTIGHRIRFQNFTDHQTSITICTDGILLEEIKFDGLLSNYDAVLVDEAHERSLRIDFLLGLLKDMHKKRRKSNLKPLKIIISSATLDTGKFRDFFSNTDERMYQEISSQLLKTGKKSQIKVSQKSSKSSKIKKTSQKTPENSEIKNLSTVPVYQVSGRTFPVEIFYEPIVSGENIYTTIANLVEKIHLSKKEGDVLIFLPGEQEILTTMRAIESLGFPNLRCLPLFSRLSIQEQTSIFAPHRGKRHVIISTNIAETSLTVPGVVTVIDSGLAKLTDFDFRTGIGSLSVQKISQASAIQRAGRAGRIEPGICYRLYAEADFLSRELFTKPEIKRSSLAEVILQMALMEIPDIQNFDFIDPPEESAFLQAYETLGTLGALNQNGTLSEIGYKMAELPLDAHISRMLLTAEKYDCVSGVALIASFLSVKDPFVRPIGEEEESDQSRKYFQKSGMSFWNADQESWRKKRKIRRFQKNFSRQFEEQYFSDLFTFLAVWKTVFAIPDDKTRKNFCAENYLNFEVLEEVKLIFEQLIETLEKFWVDKNAHLLKEAQAIIVADHSSEVLQKIPAKNILKSVATGLIQNLCIQDTFLSYRSTKTRNIMIHPGSLFFKRRPKVFVAAELTETTQIFARNISEIDSTWLSEIAPWLNLEKLFQNFYRPKRPPPRKFGKRPWRRKKRW